MSGECDKCGEHATDCRCHIRNKEIANLPFTIRTQNILRNADINTIGELLDIGWLTFKSFRNVGKKTLKEIQDYLAENDIVWGEKPKDSHTKNELLNVQIEYAKLERLEAAWNNAIAVCPPDEFTRRQRDLLWALAVHVLEPLWAMRKEKNNED